MGKNLVKNKMLRRLMMLAAFAFVTILLSQNSVYADASQQADGVSQEDVGSPSDDVGKNDAITEEITKETVLTSAQEQQENTGRTVPDTQAVTDDAVTGTGAKEQAEPASKEASNATLSGDSKLQENDEQLEEDQSGETEQEPGSNASGVVITDSTVDDAEDPIQSHGEAADPAQNNAGQTEEATDPAQNGASQTEETADPGVDIYRIYNPNSGEHFYTENYVERDYLLRAGWNYEGIGWTAPTKSDKPVFRLYSIGGGDHFYTMSAEERDFLKKAGWIFEGIGWYSADENKIPLYRAYNPNARTGAHNFTTSAGENQKLISLGWKDEGIGWYAITDPDPTPTHPVTIYKGYDLSNIYDFQYYESTYADIRAAYGNDDQNAIEHFAVFGLVEGRKGKSTYSQSAYDAAKLYFHKPKPVVKDPYPEATQILNRIGRDLKAAFNYACMKWVKSDTSASKGTHYYAHIGYTRHTGNCYVMAGTFCELAKALGYNAVQVSGRVPLRRGGLGPHSWVEIDGYVYDPDFQVESGKNGYHIYYGKSGTWRYQKQTYMGA